MLLHCLTTGIALKLPGHMEVIFMRRKLLTGYLPLLRFSGINLNAIFFASKDGKEYFCKKPK